MLVRSAIPPTSFPLERHPPPPESSARAPSVRDAVYPRTLLYREVSYVSLHVRSLLFVPRRCTRRRRCASVCAINDATGSAAECTRNACGTRAAAQGVRDNPRLL